MNPPNQKKKGKEIKIIILLIQIKFQMKQNVIGNKNKAFQKERKLIFLIFFFLISLDIEK